MRVHQPGSPSESRAGLGGRRLVVAPHPAAARDALPPGAPVQGADRRSRSCRCSGPRPRRCCRRTWSAARSTRCNRETRSQLIWLVSAFVGRGRARRRARLRPDVLHRAGPASGCSPTCGTHLFGHLQRLSLGFFERNRAGVIISRLTNDVEALDQLVTDGVTSLVQNTLTLVGTAVVLFFLDWRLALATLVVIPAMATCDRLVPQALGSRAYRAVRETLGAVTATLAEDIAGMRVLQAFTRERAAQDNFREVGDDVPHLEHADGRPQRRLLPGRRLPLVDRDRDRARLRRLARLRTARSRSARSSRSSAT